MATYSGAVDYIISQLGRGGETSITANVQQEVLNAIDYYSTTRFWFNEYTTKLTTSSSLAYYPLPADLQQIDSVFNRFIVDCYRRRDCRLFIWLLSAATVSPAIK